ncbi:MULTISPECIES: hypothetical protein [Flavobacterium]|uniref:hypothetical protein n=1 Tax=Flavobacterium TaxID=237 RepID=UPI001FCABF13|nr:MULTISPECIES: hypothetical protein [Flavobacterium]UOK42139.1 hypothetical protein LZF87_12570 [Flavobacterium enshiense]UOK42178.1 hypothetical protein LZF87_12770 [Flavobacterium enshiense]
MKNNLFKKIYLLAFFAIIIGTMMKISNINGSQILFIIGILSTLGYIIIGIYEVNVSKKINQSEKIMWTIGFIVIHYLAGLLYLLGGRKRIA